jgi:hypothetical protein
VLVKRLQKKMIAVMDVVGSQLDQIAHANQLQSLKIAHHTKLMQLVML